MSKLIRIGMMDSENSHALAFSRIANLQDPLTGGYAYPDVRVSGIFGLNKEQTQKVAREANIGFIAEKPEDLLGIVDAAMVVFRHGGLHAGYAMPFIEAGIPVWIDKPFTIDIAEARQLISAAKAGKVLLMGGSNLKLAYDVLMLRNSVVNKSIGDIVSGIIDFPADLSSEYGGLFFYGAHLVETALAIFGNEVKSVITSVHNGQVAAIAKYEGFQVILDFTKGCPQHFGIIYGTKRTLIREIDISMIYRLGFDEFVRNLREGNRNVDSDKLLKPVILLNAIMKSAEGHREVFLEELEQ